MRHRKPIAFYGTLMRGGGAQARLGIVERLRFVGPCRLRGILLDLGSYPGLVDVDESTGVVEAELFELLDDKILAVLDDFEGYYPGNLEASFYARCSRQLLEPGIEAWVYIYQGERSQARVIDSGRWSLGKVARADLSQSPEET